MTNNYTKYALLCLFMILISITSIAQQVQPSLSYFSGVVTDKDNKALEGVEIKIQEKSSLDRTGSDGKFTISAANNDILIIEKDGYATQIVTYREDDTQKVFVLHQLRLYDDEYVNIPYGKQTKRNSVASISEINSTTINKNGVARIEESMIGTLSGLYTQAIGGYRFGINNIALSVRGRATTASTAPLILVDDLEADIMLMDYRDVESVTVLKDAVALAMYGMRGANGVILIKTKLGSDLDNSIKVEMRVGVQRAINISDRLNAYQYTSLYNEALVNDGQAPIYDPTVYQGDFNRHVYPDVNFKDEYLKSSSPYQHYLISGSGGNHIAKYYVSGGYLKQEGLFKNTGANNRYERFNFRSNVDAKLTNYLEMGIKASAAIDNNRVPYTGQWSTAAVNNIFGKIINLPANAYPLFNENGSLGGTSQYKENIHGILNRRGNRVDNSRVLNVTATAKHDLSMLIPGLAVDGYFGLENVNKQWTAVYREYSVSELQPDGTYINYGKDKNSDTRDSGLDNGFYRYMTYGFGLSYTKTFKNIHQVSSRLLLSQNTQTMAGDNPDMMYQGLSFRGSYAYNNRYLAELTAAYQGSNNYKSGNRFGLFPAVGAGWIFSEEQFMKDISFINFSKVRASYGIVGNDQTNGIRFPYRQIWTTGGGYDFGNPNGSKRGSTEGTLANPGEKWEKSYKLNVGIDMQVLSDLTFSLEYFDEKRKDILVDYSNMIPEMIGIDVGMYNGGQVNNKGLEFDITYKKKVGNVSLLFSGNLLWAKNKIIDLKEIAYPYDYMYRKGHSLNTRFGYKTNGMYTSEEQLQNSPMSEFGKPGLGSLAYVNQNSGDDNILNPLDKVVIGNWVPEFIYNTTFGLEYKGFDFSATINGLGNHDVYLRPDQFTPYAYENRWTPDNPSRSTSYPRLSISSDYDKQISDFWQESGRSLNISSLEFGYTFPKVVLKTIKLSSLRLYINGNNVYTFSNIKDERHPQAVNAGYSEFPLLRTWSLGLSVKL